MHFDAVLLATALSLVDSSISRSAVHKKQWGVTTLNYAELCHEGELNCVLLAQMLLSVFEVWLLETIKFGSQRVPFRLRDDPRRARLSSGGRCDAGRCQHRRGLELVASGTKVRGQVAESRCRPKGWVVL